MVASGQNQLFPLRGYIAETYAKVMGSSSPSQPSLKPECTLLFCSWTQVAGWFSPPIGYTIRPPLRGGSFFGCSFALEKFGWPSLPRAASGAAWHPWSRGVCEVKEEDGVPCTIQAHEQMVVKVGSGTFELKGAE